VGQAAVCSFDVHREGKHSGYLRIADSTNESGWGYHSVPITSIRNGAGPRILVLGGNHGDEYEGQIVALTLARRLIPADVRGHILIIPVLSLAASAAGTRLWPDGTNFNRVFPGRSNGTIAQRLAYYLSRELFPNCDCVVDMHSGGRGMCFIPSSNMVWVADAALRQTMVDHMLAWGTAYHCIGSEQPSTDPHSLLPGDVVRQGRAVSTGEFGGAGIAPVETVSQTLTGLVRFLRNNQVLVSGPLADVELNDRLVDASRYRAPDGKAPAPDSRIVDMRDANVLVSAPEDGLYENCVDLYDVVQPQATVGRIHALSACNGAVVEVRAPHAGIVLLVRGYPPVRRGDVVCSIAPCYDNIGEFSSAASEAR